MSNSEYLAVIKFFTQKGLSTTEITKQLADVYDDSAASYLTVAKWVAEFKDLARAFEDAPRSSRRSTALTDESIRAVDEVMMRVIDKFLFDAYLTNWPCQQHHSTKS